MSNLAVQSLDSFLTFDDIAVTAGISRVAVLKRKGIDTYFVKQISNGGRPIKLFHPEALKLFGIEPQSLTKENNGRKLRNDKDSSRILSEEMEMAVVNKAKEMYLAQGNKNFILNAVRTACFDCWNDEYAKVFPDKYKMTDYFYKRRIKGSSKSSFVGYADRYPTWQIQWKRKNKKHDVALKREQTANYKYLELLEDAGKIGKGFGAATIWVLDDHQGDSMLYDPTKEAYKGSLPKGLFMIDGITGMFLDYMPGEVTSISIAMMLVRNILKYGLPYSIGLENAKAMKNLKLDSLICSLYSDEALKWYKEGSGDWFHELFPRAKDPIARNMPNIPKAPFKAKLENLFKSAVKVHDGWKFPETFRGGGIDPVQLRVSNTPKQPIQLYSQVNYDYSLKQYLAKDYIEVERPNMFEGFNKRTGLVPTVANVWDYYGGNTNPGTGIKLEENKFVYFLYWLSQMEIETPMIIKREVKASAGGLITHVNDRQYQFVSHKLAQYEGHKITVIFIPNSLYDNQTSRDNAALFVKKGNGVEYICTAEDQIVRKVSDIRPVRENIRETRRIMKAIETPYEIEMNRPYDYAKELKATMEQAPLLPEPEVKKLEEPKLADELLDLINL